jgi:chorismate mutase
MHARIRHYVLLILTFAGLSVGCERGPASSLSKSPASPSVAGQRELPPDLSESIDSILALMNRRLDLMHEVARWKWNAKRPIEDRDRELILLDRLAGRAEERGVEVTFARRFLEAQMTASKMIQSNDFLRFEETGQESFSDVADLGETLRPQISALSESLLIQLAQLDAHPTSAACRAAIRVRAQVVLCAPGVTEPIRLVAIGPLVDPPATSGHAVDSALPQE